MYWNGLSASNGAAYFSDAACSVPIGGSIDTLTQEQVLNGIDYETPSKQENIDWLKALQGGAAKNSTTGKKGGMGTFSIILVGAGVFVLVLLLMGAFNKK